MVSPDLISVNTNIAAAAVTAEQVLYTGHYGGKRFICNAESVIRVPTGEQGYDALEDDVKEIALQQSLFPRSA